MIKIVIDCYGGDNSPIVNIEGAIKAINELKDLSIVFVGKEDEINNSLKNLEYDKSRVEIINADEIISLNALSKESVENLIFI